jgi:hypothetical protein
LRGGNDADEPHAGKAVLFRRRRLGYSGRTCPLYKHRPPSQPATVQRPT